MTCSLVTLTSFKIISLSTNVLLSLPFPFLDVLLGGCLLNHSRFICYVCDAVPYHLKYSSFQGHLYFRRPKKVYREDSQMNREAVEGQELNSLMANVFHSGNKRIISQR
jgi:hypothetical protein